MPLYVYSLIQIGNIKQLIYVKFSLLKSWRISRCQMLRESVSTTVSSDLSLSLFLSFLSLSLFFLGRKACKQFQVDFSKCRLYRQDEMTIILVLASHAAQATDSICSLNRIHTWRVFLLTTTETPWTEITRLIVAFENSHQLIRVLSMTDALNFQFSTFCAMFPFSLFSWRQLVDL